MFFKIDILGDIKPPLPKTKFLKSFALELVSIPVTEQFFNFMKELVMGLGYF